VKGGGFPSSFLLGSRAEGKGKEEGKGRKREAAEKERKKGGLGESIERFSSKWAA
jgi:hypothetical protein